MGVAVEQVLRQAFVFTSGEVPVRLARRDDVGRVSELFDAYRVFYRQPSDPLRARRFIEERMDLHESVILVADCAPDPIGGFAQLYPSFTSAGTARTWILNDLFVDPGQRRRRVGRALVSASIELARVTDAVSVSLATERTNAAAQPLYESLGFQRDETFVYYRLRVPSHRV